MTCFDCRNVQIWMRSQRHGLFFVGRIRNWLRSRLSVCWICQMRRCARLHIAGRLAMLSLVVFAVCAAVITLPFALTEVVRWAVGT